MHLLNPLKGFDPAIAREYKNKLLFENIRRLKYVALAGSSVNALILIIYLGSNGLDRIFSAESVLRLAWIAASVAYIFMIGRPKNHETLNIRHRIVFFGAASLSLLFSGVIMSLLFVNTGYTFIYIVNCMITGSFLYFSFFEILIVLWPTLGFFAVVMATSWQIIPNFTSNLINIVTVTVFSVMIATMTYRSHVSLLDSQSLINEHNHFLKQLAEMDGLTRLPNRRKFEQIFCMEWARAFREKQPLSIIMIDIDYFKNYNDYYGHLAGDDCLKQIADSLRSSMLRQTDFVCRYGGEEFIVILPNTDQYGAVKVAEKIRQNVAAACIPHAGSSFKQITLSMGIATLAGFDSYSKEELISAADKAMYSVKLKGRNQIASVMLT